MKRAAFLLVSLTALAFLYTACTSKKNVPPQPPIPPPPLMAETTSVGTETLPPTPTTIPPALKPAAALATIHFDFNKYDIRPQDARMLDGNADYLRANPNTGITLEGYCDPIGTEEYNRGLGLRRANSAKAYLVKLGIDAGRLATISFGEEKLVTTDTAKFELNRRVESVVK